MCLPKHGGDQGNKFLVTHPMTDQHCLTSAIARRSALTARPLSSKKYMSIYNRYLKSTKQAFEVDSREYECLQY
jgi:hypothetical protein